MPKSSSRNEPLSRVTFSCRPCSHRFESDPGRIEDAPDRAHPWLYFASCPLCGAEAEQAPWEKALMASYGKHTGPRTAEGKARSSANLEGHPTPEESLRTRFNGLKHGMFAKTATYFPARPGAYPECARCEYLDNGCSEQVACLKQTELFMRYHIAYESGDPAPLMEIQAQTQALVQWTINQMMLAIIATGVELRKPEWYFDPMGKEFHIVSYQEGGVEKIAYEVSAHPLLKTLGDFLAKNNMSLADFNMTPKVREEKNLIEGFLDESQASRETLEQYAHQQTRAIENLTGMIDKSREKLRRDPVLIEHGADADG